MVAKSIAIVTIMEGTREADGVRQRHTLLLTLDLRRVFLDIFLSFTSKEEVMMIVHLVWLIKICSLYFSYSCTYA